MAKGIDITLLIEFNTMNEKAGRFKMVPRWARPEHPIFWLESWRQVRNRGLVALQRAFVPVLFAVASLAVLVVMLFSLLIVTSGGYYDLDSSLALVLGFVIAVLFCIQIGAGGMANILTVLLAAPLISGEVELQSWQLLRTTMVSLPEIILAKLSAVLHELRLVLRSVVIIRVISTVTIVLFFAHVMIRQTFYSMSAADLRRFFFDGLGVAYIILIASIVSYNLSQPVIQAVLCGMLGMTASAYARTRAQAISGGLGARLFCWVSSTLLHFGLAYGLGYLFNNWSYPAYAQLDIFRNVPSPTETQIAWAACLTVSGYLLASIIAQVGLILILTGLVFRRARRLGD
ncbi:MAG: hypothetical protein JXB07_05395 [Anaerolineae bacterium]|nr:hypothetical protein [Anaerolineae bacterium]